MGQAISSEFLINHSVREVIWYDNFLSGNIFRRIEDVKVNHSWSSTDDVEYHQVDGDGEELEYLEQLVCNEQYRIHREKFPKVLLERWKLE